MTAPATAMLSFLFIYFSFKFEISRGVLDTPRESSRTPLARSEISMPNRKWRSQPFCAFPATA
jgi:hypothetical protein